MKKLLSIVCLLLPLAMLASCHNAPKTTEPAATTTSSDAPEEQTPVTSLSLTVEGNDIADYTIVYADSLYEKAVLRQFTTEHDFFKLIAEDIAGKIYAQTGVQLPVVRDSSAEERELEILVGPTDRSESDPIDALDVFKTYVKPVGSKLVVGAGYDSTVYTGNLRKSYCYASTYHAWDAVEAYLNEVMAAGLTELDLSKDADFSTTVDLITVACIGDSITEGAGSTARDYHSYPAVLGRILWKDHLIVNVGNSGKTMRDDLALHYRGTTQHAALRRYAHLYDYAFLMLGTNDSYYDRSWPASSDEKYLTSADNLVKDLTKTNDRVQVVVMNCPMYYGTNGSGSAKVRALQNLLPARFEAMGVKSSFFDMYTFTKEQVGSKNFPDQLHPNDTGHSLMAKELAKVLEQLVDGSYTYVLPKV